jgi:chromosome partitioning protein
MARVIAIANQKGGVGKTTTAINLAASLAVAEKRVLAIDLDPQGNLTSGFGLEKAPGLYDALFSGARLAQTAPTPLAYLRVLQSDADLAGLEVELASADEREYRLKAVLAAVRSDYDFILMDTPPSIGLIAVNALTAADSVIVPIQCEYFALEGLGAFLGTLGRIQASLNPSVVLEGVLLTMADERTNLLPAGLSRRKSPPGGPGLSDRHTEKHPSGRGPKLRKAGSSLRHQIARKRELHEPRA